MSMAPRRILSIWLAAFAIDRWRLGEGCARGEGADAQPLVLIAETAHGPVAGGETTEGALAKLMLRSRVGHTSSGGGATRLSFVDECEGFACAAEALC